MGLRYDHISKHIKLCKVGVYEYRGEVTFLRKHYIKNELCSDDFNLKVNEPGSLQRRLQNPALNPDTKIDDYAQNMIITKERVNEEISKTMNGELLDNINEAIKEIKEVNYDDFLRAGEAAVKVEEEEKVLQSLMTAVTDGWEEFHKQYPTEWQSEGQLRELPPDLKLKISEYEEAHDSAKKARAKSAELLEIAENYHSVRDGAAAPAVAPAAAPNKGMTDEEYEKWLEKNEAKFAKIADPNWVDDHKQQPKGGSTRKNKYISRITSRKRRLYRKKSRKVKKAYKKLKSRKMARK